MGMIPNNEKHSKRNRAFQDILEHNSTKDGKYRNGFRAKPKKSQAKEDKRERVTKTMRFNLIRVWNEYQTKQDAKTAYKVYKTVVEAGEDHNEIFRDSQEQQMRDEVCDQFFKECVEPHPLFRGHLKEYASKLIHEQVISLEGYQKADIEGKIKIIENEIADKSDQHHRNKYGELVVTECLNDCIYYLRGEQNRLKSEAQDFLNELEAL